jgi:ATP-binding cassette subfamily C protein CydCD
VAPTSANAPLLSFRDVSFRYPVGADGVVPDQDALAPLSFDVYRGEVVALAGPSGAGKSTALGLAAGFLRPSAGQVRAPGKGAIAWVGQEPGMVNGTVADNIALGSPGTASDLLRDALDRVGGESIPLSHPVGDAGEGLSSGERRRVAMARALVRIEHGGATLLLLDEPTAGLDQAAEAQAVEAVRTLSVAVLVVSHRPAVLDSADRVVQVRRAASAMEVAA